ncbi:MAG: DUF3108 domain-containing protein [Ignavibacteria bacterium]|nr:DUF3108 domain-containing protein [Ignavibacteria bacterium]
MRNLFFICLFVTGPMLFASWPGAHEYRTELLTFTSENRLKVGEEITYQVKYYLMKLGEIKLKILSKKEVEGTTQSYPIAYIDSYTLPFVNLHQTYETRLTGDFFSAFFKCLDKKSEYTTFTEYNFDYSNRAVKIKKGKVYPYVLWTDSTGTAETEFHDGLSIFYYARMNLGKKKSVTVPCLVNEKKVTTRLNFYTDVEKISIDACSYPISVLRLDGETNFVSVFGLTGYFEGWFSNDEARIPIVAKLNVLIGRVTVELIKWKREGWNPPKYQ